MSPVARSQRHAGKALLVAGVGVVVAMGLAFAMSVLSNRGSVEVRLGDDVFQAGNAESIAERIAAEEPITYSDVAGGNKDIVVQHLGDQVNTGWYAFAARPPGTSRDCSVDWQPDSQTFVLPCTNEEFPADGAGLPQYRVRVTEDGDLRVDVRGESETETESSE